MKEKPDIHEVEKVIPEAKQLVEIGSGGFKIVYKAKVRKKIEAVKLVIIPTDDTDSSISEENKNRIIREIDILSKCNSPYLVKLAQIAPRDLTIDGIDYVIYSEEYIAGESLRRKIQAQYRPNQSELCQLCICMLLAVQELSARNVIHRDIKPDNIIKTHDSKRAYILLDLGIAFRIGGTPITRNSTRIPGTLYYIAPEMLDPGFRQSLDYRADLYTIALTVYEYASGINPFAHASDPQFTTLYRIKTEKPEPLEKLRSDLSLSFCQIINQLLRKLPALRPANINKLITSMESFE